MTPAVYNVGVDDSRVPTREFKRALRNYPTPTERGLWRALKGKRLGFLFTRQYEIGDYIVDFCCRSRKLVVELDGSSHEDLAAYDALRDNRLREVGYEMIHVSVDLWLTEPESVL